ncbi:MAG TPA: DUF1735 domain-containing protein [Parafilimonas sp.]|nr:DUF1735 domain-containing protein [Parafilimonas sp.]
MKRNILLYVGLVFTTLILVSSCIKDDTPGVGNAGTPQLKIMGAPKQSLFYSPFTDVKKIDLLSVRRDETSPAGIDQAITVKIMAEPDSVAAYNDANGTTYEPLPDSVFSLAGNGTSRDGNLYVVPMASKAIGNELTILLDGSKWDVTHKYAMMFTVADAAGLKIADGAGSIFVTIEAKNKWDGVYAVEGSQADIYSPELGNINLYLSYDNQYADPPMQFELRTLSPTKCICYDNYFYGGEYKPISVNNGDGTFTYSAYGSFCPIFEFDPATDKIIGVTNSYGQPASNSRSAAVDPSGQNQYDASSKTINIKYFMLQPSLIPDPYIRVSFTEKWTYLGPRG